MASLEYQKKWDFDWMKITPSHRYAVEDYGREGRYDGNPEGDVKKGPSPIASIEQFEALKPLDITKGALARQLRCLKLIGKQAGDNPFIQTIFNPFSVARFLVDERCYIWMRKYPKQFKKGLESITETWVNFIGEVNKTGASGIYLSVSDACYSLMSWEEYKEFGVPGDQALLAANKGWLTVLHHHGDDLMFEYIAKYPVQIMLVVRPAHLAQPGRRQEALPWRGARRHQPVGHPAARQPQGRGSRDQRGHRPVRRHGLHRRLRVRHAHPDIGNQHPHGD